jgi:acyl-CoA dehydrogenase
LIQKNKRNSGRSPQDLQVWQYVVANIVIPNTSVAIEVALSASIKVQAAVARVVLAPERRQQPVVVGDRAPADTESLSERAARVAAIAVRCAAAVDRDSAFPAEAMAAIRSERLLGAAVPREFGGEGAGVDELADVCYALGRACAATAMIFAMHQTKLAAIIRHGRDSAWHQLFLRRVCSEQLLLASSTTEGSRGGDIRNSIAPIEQRGSRIALHREASVISYGEAADAIVTTARRAADAPSADQVLVVFLKGDYTLERLSGWDALGMRGTCSAGFKLVASGVCEQILPVPYDQIHARTVMPVAHLLWSSAWAGIAAAATDRARAFVRKAMQSADGGLPPSAAHLTRADASLRTLLSLIAGAVHRFDAAADDAATLESIDFQTGMNLLKVTASELAVSTVMSAMQTCGLAGYRNDGPFSIGRHLRDVLSSPVMINNDRILGNLAMASLLSGAPASLSEHASNKTTGGEAR